MGLGYALSEDFPLSNGVPTAKFGTLGLFRATAAPEIETILVRGRGAEEPSPRLAPPAYGAKGVGELATIPTAPAVHGAYYRLDKKFRPKLPMEETYYDK
jgi:CO/xanthine dehydrogenase Mo-binding subunit